MWFPTNRVGLVSTPEFPGIKKNRIMILLRKSQAVGFNYWRISYTSCMFFWAKPSLTPTKYHRNHINKHLQNNPHPKNLHQKPTSSPSIAKSPLQGHQDVNLPAVPIPATIAMHRHEANVLDEDLLLDGWRSNRCRPLLVCFGGAKNQGWFCWGSNVGWGGVLMVG